MSDSFMPNMITLFDEKYVNIHIFYYYDDTMEPLLNIAISAANSAAKIILHHVEQLDQINVSTKAHGEFVTEVDLKAEQAIIRTIRKAYPHHNILTEESGLHQGDSAITWIIDPIDGTKNYIHGFPFYAVSIAVSIKNRIEHAVVYDPNRHECFSASRGRGARLNERKIRVSKRYKLSEALLGTGFPPAHQVMTEEQAVAFKALCQQCCGIRRLGSAALELAHVAAGRLDGAWKIRLRPWDIAAGTLLIEEAGGITSDLNNRPNDFSQERVCVLAGNPKIHKALLDII